MSPIDWTSELEVTVTGASKELRFKRNRTAITDIFREIASGAGYDQICDRFGLKHQQLVALQQYLFEVLTATQKLDFTGELIDSHHLSFTVRGSIEFADTWDHVRVHLDPISGWTKFDGTKLGESTPRFNVVGKTTTGDTVSFILFGDPQFLYPDKANFQDAFTYLLARQFKERPCQYKTDGLLVEYHLKRALGAPNPCEARSRNFILAYQAQHRFDIANSNHFSGLLQLEPTSEGAQMESTDWLYEASAVSEHAIAALSFALGNRVEWAIIRTFYRKDESKSQSSEDEYSLAEEVLRPSTGRQSQRINSVHFLNLKPLLEAVATTFDTRSEAERGATQLAIYWYLSGDTSESKFIACTIAIEHLIEELIGAKNRLLVKGSTFSKAKKRIKELITADPTIEAILRCDEIEMITKKLGELNRKSAESNIYNLLLKYDVPHRDLGHLIKKIIERRNKITHKGEATWSEALDQVVARAAEELCIRIIQALLGLDDTHIQHALTLDCESVFPKVQLSDLLSQDNSRLEQAPLGLVLFNSSTLVVINFNSMAENLTRELQGESHLQTHSTQQSHQNSPIPGELVSSWLREPEIAKRLNGSRGPVNLLDEAFYFQARQDSQTFRIGLKSTGKDSLTWLLLAKFFP